MQTSKRLWTGVGLLLAFGACGFTGKGDDSPTTLQVLSSTPIDGATDVAVDGIVSATFSDTMDPATLTTSTFTLTSGAAAVPGTVTYADSTAVFHPTTELASDAAYTATITLEATSGAGVALASAYTWSFTGDRLIGPGGPPVNLRTAANYVVLAKASISGTGATVTGNLGLSPAAASYITGLSLIEDPSNAFWTSAQVTGRVYAADNGGLTPATLLVALADMQLAYADVAGRVPQVTDLAGGNLGGMTLPPGVYRWSGVTIPSDVTLAGKATDVWIFQIAGTLGVTAGAKVILAGGAVPEHVFWQLAGAVTIGAAAHLEGVVLTATALTSGAGTTIKGRVLSQTDVTITNSTID